MARAYYLVKTTSKATNENPSFAGQECVAYYGKEDKLLKYEGTHAEAIHMTCDWVRWMLEDYGFKRECDARRSWCYKNPENTKFWTSTAEVVKVEEE